MYAPQLGRFASQDPLAAEPTLLYDNNSSGGLLEVMRNRFGYTGNNPVNFSDPSGLISEAGLTHAVADLKACAAGGRLFDKASGALKKDPPGKGVAISTKPADDLVPNSSNVMTGSILIDGADPRCTALETILVELSHIANRGAFIKLIQGACDMTRASYIRAMEENEFSSRQSAVETWKACSAEWKCPDRCPTYGNPDDVLKETFEQHFKKLTPEHKEFYGKDWDRRCK